MNLACKAALAAITSLSLVDDTKENYEDYEPTSFNKDVIATIRAFVNAVYFHVLLSYCHLTKHYSRFAKVVLKKSHFLELS